MYNDEEGDFLNDLILSAFKDNLLERASFIFATQNYMTASPLSSLTAAARISTPSKRVPGLNGWQRATKRCRLKRQA